MLPFKTPLPNANPVASLLDTGTFFAIDMSTRVTDLAPNAALHSVCQPLNGLGNDVLTSTSSYDAEFVIGGTKVIGRVLVSPKFSPPLPYDILVGKTVYEKFGGFVCLDNDVVYVNGYSFPKTCGAAVEATGNPDVPLRYTYEARKIPEKQLHCSDSCLAPSVSSRDLETTPRGTLSPRCASLISCLLM